MATDWDAKGKVAFVVSLAGSHYVVDSKRWKENFDSFPTRSIWFDQMFHVIALAVSVFLAEKADER